MVSFDVLLELSVRNVDGIYKVVLKAMRALINRNREIEAERVG